jgi:hypothetical protein
MAVEQYRPKEPSEEAASLANEDSAVPERGQGDEAAAAEATEPPSPSLERIEAAVRLVANHLQVTSRAAQVLEAEQPRITLTAVALGISATSVLALISLSVILPRLSTDLLGLALAMSLIFLGSVLDLSAGASLRKAVNRAIQGRDPSDIALERGPWFRLLQAEYWTKVRQMSPDLFFYYIVRASTLVIYAIAVSYMLWAVISLYR